MGYRFGVYLIDVAGRELRRHGEEVVVQPRVFDLLVYLAENRDRAVDKDELQDAVWPGMVITETALTRAVMKARKAVGDDATAQAVIKTLHGHGYRFVAELEPVETASEQPVPAAPEVMQASQGAGGVPVSSPTGKAGGMAKLVSNLVKGLAVVLILTLAWIALRPPESLGNETRIAVLPLQDSTGDPELSWTSLGLMSYATSLLKTDGEIPVVAEGSVISVADGFGWGGDLEDPQGEVVLGKLRSVYGASHILYMLLENEGRALRLTYRLIGPDGSSLRGTMVGDQGTDLTHGVVQSVYGSLLRRSRIGDDMPLVSTDPFNNEAFARGMSLKLEGRCAEAVQFFRIIIEQEPTLFAPRFEYAGCLRILGEWEESEELLTGLVAEQRAVEAPRPLSRTLMTLGVLYNRTGRLDEADQVHEEALQLALSIDDNALAARILQNMAIVAEDRSDWKGSEALLDRALLAYREAGLEVLPGHLFSAQANLAMDQGNLAEAELLLEQALQAFREAGDRRNEAMMLNNTGYLRRLQGRMDEAEDYHLRSLEIRQEIGDRVGVGRIYGMLGVVYTSRGLYAEAVEAAQSALEIARETRDRLFEGTSLAQLADAKKALGEWEDARRYYLEGKAVFVDIQDRMRALQSDMKLARLDLLEAHWGQAETTALYVLEQSRANELMQPEIQAMELLGDIALARGDLPAATAEYEATLERVRQSTWTGKENTLLHKLANAYMDAQNSEAAAPLIGALTLQEPNVQSLKAQARFAHANGDRQAALDLMLEAKQLAGEHWAPQSEEILQSYTTE
jgi:DNA-binding winged helix-turn-helix (wHTH) protein/tetratricopeptide (TPR) repeat protein/TolB-like protein